MSRAAPLLLTLFLLVALVASATAWGQVGHSTVASIAYNNLSPTAKSRVDAIVAASPDFDTIESGSIWPDSHRTPTSGPQHYLNLQDDPLKGDCPRTIPVLPPNCKNGGCVITAIATNARDLATNKDNPKAAWQALANVVHYVGDVTCPMHITGYGRGGNEVPMKTGKRKGNLHSAWDGVILDMTIRKYFGGSQDAWFNHVVELTRLVEAKPQCTSAEPANVDQVTKCATMWAEDTAANICTIVYGPNFQVNGKIEGPYHASVRDLADMQLAKAGARLGALLNKALGGQ